jgi:hypothetical protein
LQSSYLSDAIVITVWVSGAQADTATIPVTVQPVNHAPSAVLVGKVVPSFVMGAAYVVPAVNFNDVDVALAPDWPMTVTFADATSVTAVFSLMVKLPPVLGEWYLVVAMSCTESVVSMRTALPSLSTVLQHAVGRGSE